MKNTLVLLALITSCYSIAMQNNGNAAKIRIEFGRANPGNPIEATSRATEEVAGVTVAACAAYSIASAGVSVSAGAGTAVTAQATAPIATFTVPTTAPTATVTLCTIL